MARVLAEIQFLFAIFGSRRYSSGNIPNQKNRPNDSTQANKMRKLIILFLASLVVISCKESSPSENLNGKDDSFSVINDSVTKEINRREDLGGKVDSLKAINDSLTKKLALKTDNSNYWYNQDYDGQKFKKNGIANPEEFIINALRKRTDLIPLKAVLGGTMRFGNMQVLSSKWVIADYDDGHIQGKGVFKYRLKNNGELEFELMDSVE